jgi:hypothetical protein
MKNKNLVIIIVAVIVAAVVFFILKARGVIGSGPFKVGDYIQKKIAPNSAIWKVTEVKPDMEVAEGSITYTGAYYALCVQGDSSFATGTSALWPIDVTNKSYVKVNYSK